ncbi:MAG: FAD-dependent oxidoreductase [Burkholderiaceae bacterium]
MTGTASAADRRRCDVLVAGSGAGALAAAVTAASQGLRVLVVEKEAVCGGTTARSGGVLWIPLSPQSRQAGVADELAAARRYLQHEAGPYFDAARVDAFLAAGPRMIEFFEQQTSVRFVAVPEFSDYHPGVPGAVAGGRSVLAAPFQAQELGADVRRLRPPLREITFVGMMFNASKEVGHFFNCTRSPASAWYVLRRLLQHAGEMVRYGRAQRLTNGNALAARLMKSALDGGIEIRTGCALTGVEMDGGRVRAARVRQSGGDEELIDVAQAVVLGTGGFPQDPELRRQLFPHAPTGAEHWSPAPPGNTGDGWRIALSAGGSVERALPNAAAWIPVSLVPRRKAAAGVFPHLIDRYKPGIIAVLADGRRFVNEADSYHDFGQALQRACRGRTHEAWLVCDHRALRRYGLGYVKPFPLPIGPHLRSGYLLRGSSPAELGRAAGIDPVQLERTIEDFNRHAEHGEDPVFGKGSTAYNRYLGDPAQQPNPCVAPLRSGPYYAVRVVLGDLGTFCGIRTDAHSRVLGDDGTPIGGLYAVGNDAASVMGGAYPGGGITLGPAMTFGYLAGMDIAQRSRAARPEAAASVRADAVG